MSIELPITLDDKLGRPFVVRRFDLADRVALEAMYEDFEPKRAAQGLPPMGEEAVRRWLDRLLGRGIQLVVEVGGRVLGHVMLIPMDDETLELANFLHQSIRNRGIGTAVNRLGLELARDAGYRRVWLSVEATNRAAVRSYKKAGFEVVPGTILSPEIEMVAVVAE
ncbi:MAG TPA: GNAT family N-acetyltransferase [Longimicrobiales bacterium]|nr:GNAT family N-acetyltransferase [Longimicrobiales bacterium]